MLAQQGHEGEPARGVEGAEAEQAPVAPRPSAVPADGFERPDRPERGLRFFLGAKFLTHLTNLLYGAHIHDEATCYKVFRADLLKSMQLRSNRFGIEVELTAYIAKVRARVYELPISYFPRTRLQGKKINWKDGFAALGHLIRFNFFISLQQAFEHIPPKYLPGATALESQTKSF